MIDSEEKRHVECLANRLARKVPRSVPRSDIQQAAWLGWWRAKQSFRPELGFYFSTWADRKIYGAVMDALRREYLLSGLRNCRNHLPDPEIVPLSGCGHALVSQGESPEESTLRADVVRRLGKAILRLPQRQQYILHALYWQGRTQNDIGKELGVTFGRVSQLHQQALINLRRYARNLHTL